MNLRCFFLPCVASGRCQCYTDTTNREDSNGRDPIEFLDKEFDALSPEEKQRIHNEIYGIHENDEDNETETFVNTKLQELEMEIQKLGSDSKQAYDRALEMEQQQQQRSATTTEEDCYVQSRSFRMLFLRAEKYNAKLAARRITRFFREKLEIFGEEKLLQKQIRQADFDDRDTQALYGGAVCYCGTDTAGRSILFMSRRRMQKYSILSLKRVFYYIFQLAIERNEQSQKKGIVMIVHNLNREMQQHEQEGLLPPPITNPLQLMRFRPIDRMCHYASPVRNAAFHICYDDFSEHVLMNVGLVLVPKSMRPTVVLHYCLHSTELKHSLEDYGIDMTHLYLNAQGHFEPQKLQQNLEEQSRLENASTGRN